jgi:probable phosphoglycerate mutase
MRRHFQRPFSLGPDATELVLVRHGATVSRTAGAPTPLVGGQSDPPLTDAGRRQADAVAARLAGMAIDGLFITDLRRTSETAAPLAAALGIEPVVIPELREIHLGEWEGGEFQARVMGADPLVQTLFREGRWDVLPGAETMDAFSGRVLDGVTRVADAVGPGNVAAAIVHGAVIAEACRHATGSRGLAFLGVENGSITRIVREGDGTWLLRSYNDTAHLEPIAA